MMFCPKCLNDAIRKKQCHNCYRIGQTLQVIWSQCIECCGSGSGSGSGSASAPGSGSDSDSSTHTTGNDAAERMPH
jgi:hypothetical protein